MLKHAEVHGKERHKPCGTKNLMSVFQKRCSHGAHFDLGPAVGEEGSSEALRFGEILWSSIDQGSKALPTEAILPEILCSQHLSQPVVWYMFYILNPRAPTYSTYRHSVHWNQSIYTYSTYPGTSGPLQLPFWRTYPLNSTQPTELKPRTEPTHYSLMVFIFSVLRLFGFVCI